MNGQRSNLPGVRWPCLCSRKAASWNVCWRLPASSTQYAWDPSQEGDVVKGDCEERGGRGDVVKGERGRGDVVKGGCEERGREG